MSITPPTAPGSSRALDLLGDQSRLDAPRRGPLSTDRAHHLGRRQRVSVALRLVLAIATWAAAGIDSTVACAHEVGISTSVWRVEPTRMRGTILFAQADARALALDPSANDIDLERRAQMVARVVEVHVGEATLAPTAVAVRRNPDDESEIQIDVVYDLAKGPAELRWSCFEALPWGHRHHVKVRRAGERQATDYLLSDPPRAVRCTPPSTVKPDGAP